MIQLDHSTPTNTFAIIAETTASQLFVEFSQDYNKWKTYATTSINNLGEYLICEITGSQLPTASGLYTVNFFTGSFTTTERAWVSGSDFTSIYNYTSSNDIGKFYTYDG